MRKSQTSVFAALALATLAGSTQAQVEWSDNFDSYTAGDSLEGGVGGWSGWWGTNSGLSQVDATFASSGTLSAQLNSGCDTVFDFGQGGPEHPGIAIGGTYRLDCEVFVPNDATGKNYFIMNNEYDAVTTTTEWCVQMGMNADNSLIECDCGQQTPVNAPLVKGAWTDISVFFDIDNDLVELTYDGTLLSSYTISGGVFGGGSGVVQVNAIDLYPLGSGTPVTPWYYDNFEWTKLSGDTGSTHCNSTANSTGAESMLTASGTVSIADDNLTLTADSLPSQPGIFIGGPNYGGPIPFFNGFLCVSPSGLQRFSTVSVPSGGSVTEVVSIASSAPGGLNVSAGSPYYYQRWNRDPAAGGGNANFSSGLQVDYAP